MEQYHTPLNISCFLLDVSRQCTFIGTIKKLLLLQKNT